MSERVIIEHLTRLQFAGRIIEVPRDQARELYDALHAEFGDFDQARELSQLARESVARELRLAELEMDVMALRGDYYLEKPAATGPSLQDDIEAMVAANELEAAKQKVLNCCDAVKESLRQMADDAEWLGLEEFKPVEPSNAPEPPAEPETVAETPAPSNDQQVKMGRPRMMLSDQERAVNLWTRYRKRFPDEGLNRTVSRLCSHYPQPRPAADEIREWLRAAGIDIPTPMSRSECAAQARDCRLRKPPEGYKIVNADAWRASESLLSDADIREMAEGGLARAGLALEGEAVDW